MEHVKMQVSRAEVIDYLAEGKRLRFLLDQGEDANGGFIVLDPPEYEGASDCYVADVREGWAGGVMEAVCHAPSFYLFDSYLDGAAVWMDFGSWVRVSIDGCSTPDRAISTR